MTSISLHESLLASTGVARRSLTSLLTAYGASADAALRYWTGAVRGPKTPLDLAADWARWLEIVTHGTPPTGRRRTRSSTLRRSPSCGDS